MSLNVLIVGGGLTGILLSQELSQRRVSHKIVDNHAADSGTAASSGILNPVMGRRRQVVPNYENLLPAALQAYKKLENQLQAALLHPAEIIDIHLSTEEAHFFTERVAELPEFLQPKTLIETAEKLDAGWGATATEGGYLLDLRTLVGRYHAYLIKEKCLIRTAFHAAAVTPSAGRLEYGGESFSHIILCNGIHALETPVFERLSLSANKGQALVIQTAATLPPHSIYKWGKELSLVPLGNGQYWAGASFEWKYTDSLPTTAYKQQTEKIISRYFPYPFTVVKHLSGLRTSALDRRPVAGFHPNFEGWGTVNALGTKGVLQAPYLAVEMAKALTEGSNLSNTYSINRFARLL